MGNPAPAGARVVVLDTALASLPIAEADLGIPWNWRIGPASRPVSDETYVGQAFTPSGVGLRVFSVAHVEQPWRTPRTPGDLTIRWTRRSRALSADSWGAVDALLAEETEAYEVEILDGVTVKRVQSATTTSAIYTAAQQTADWGAPLGPGDSLKIRIFQLSARAGGARRRPSRSCSEGHPMSDATPHLLLPYILRRRPRSTLPTTRRCACSTGSSSSPFSTGT